MRPSQFKPGGLAMHSSPLPADRTTGVDGSADVSGGPLARNIELKARLVSLDAARATAARLATEELGLEIQVDTYFVCRQGRLKLRQIDGSRAQFVWYARLDRPDAKASDYRLVSVSEPEPLKAALAEALGNAGGGGKTPRNLPLPQCPHPLGRSCGAGTVYRIRSRAGPRHRRSRRSSPSRVVAGRIPNFAGRPAGGFL